MGVCDASPAAVPLLPTPGAALGGPSTAIATAGSIRSDGLQHIQPIGLRPPTKDRQGQRQWRSTGPHLGLRAPNRSGSSVRLTLLPAAAGPSQMD